MTLGLALGLGNECFELQMSLPIITLDNEEKWDCHTCGYCCRGSVVPLSDDDVRLLQSQKWNEEPEYRRTAIMTRYRGRKKAYRLAHRADGSCVFLMDNGLCRVHAKFGLENKPTICQIFPLQLIPTDKRAVLTFRRACPSAAADLGKPTEDYLPFIKDFVKAGRLEAEAIPAPMIKPGESRDWKGARIVLDAAAGLLNDDRYPPVRRLVHALQFAQLVAKAKLRNLNDKQFADLIATLVDVVPDESKPFFAERTEPKGYAKVLFRLAAVDVARLHPACRHRPQWGSRLRMVRNAWRSLRGKGPAPVVDPCYPDVDLKELDQAAGILDAEIYKPLNRFLETTSSSFLYALADRRGWSIIESIRALALLFPIGMWLLRWQGRGRQLQREDMLLIVVALDRSLGYTPLSGALHRARLSLLSAHEELERLVVWYAR
ncbi:MAG: YkgJ family cysteine cluster protein [Pirellulales bacterium]